MGDSVDNYTNATESDIMIKRQMIRAEFYNTYDVMTGIRIASTLGGFFLMMVLLVLYKSKCKTRSLSDQHLEAVIKAAVDQEEQLAALAKRSSSSSYCSGHGLCRCSPRYSMTENNNAECNNWNRKSKTYLSETQCHPYSALPQTGNKFMKSSVLEYSFEEDEDDDMEDMSGNNGYRVAKWLEVPGDKKWIPRGNSAITVSSNDTSYLEARGSSLFIGHPPSPLNHPPPAGDPPWEFYYPIDIQSMAQYSVSKGPVSVASCPIDCSIPEYLPEPSSTLPSAAVHNQNTTAVSTPFKIDYSRFINEVSSIRQPSQLREITRVLEKLPPTCIKFGVGVPNVLTFPFKKIIIELITGEHINIEGQELSDALQYLPSIGYRPLTKLLEEIQDWFHGPQNWENRAIMMTSGAQEGLCKAVDMCMSCGDSVIMPDPVYTGAIDLFRPHKADIIPIKQDSYGVVVEEIEKVLMERKINMQPIPKMIYLNPTASNPAGTTLPTNRKREIYRLACEYNMLILEDDPYYYLHFEKENPVSFLSMDTEGRVLRFDSFSKIMSSGLRIGFVTGPVRLLRQMELHMQTSSMHSSSLSQMILYKLLSQWGKEGLVSHFMHVKNFYRQKRDYMMHVINKQLKGLAEWHEPNGGMFLWLKIIGLKDTRNLVTTRCLNKLVILAPGYALACDCDGPSPYIRVSYSIASPEDVDRGVSLLAEAIREELQSL